MLRLVCIFLGCDLPIQLLLKFLSNGYDNRLVDNDRFVNPFIMYRFTSRIMKHVRYTWDNNKAIANSLVLRSGFGSLSIVLGFPFL